MLRVRLLEKRNRSGGKVYRVYYMHFPRKLVDAVGFKDGDVFVVRVEVRGGKKLLVLEPLDERF